jgi:glycosyltransferase involved in cell wall biosynthesis
MRILHVTPYFEDAWAYGGIPRVASALVRGLADRGHEVTVCTTDACSAQARLPRRTASPVPGTPPAIDLRVFANVSNAAAYHLQFFTPRGLATYLRANAGSFDVAHLHGCHHLLGAVAARHLRRNNVPYVITTHGTAPYFDRRRLAKRVFDMTVGRGVLEGATRVLAVSGAERQQLVAAGVAVERISIIPNPVEGHEFTALPGTFRRRLGLGRDVPVVLFLGRFAPDKRIDVLLTAFAALNQPDVRLVIAGNDMGYGRELRRLIAQFRLEDRVLMPGLLPGAERLHALADADVVAYPSEHEVFGLVAVEALLCGTPVIVANDSGCGEVVRETGGGLLVPPGDVDALRRAIATMLGDRAAWRRIAAQARTRAQRFSASHVCTDLDRLYAEITARDVREVAV